MEYVRCKQCGHTFLQDEPWKKICLSCWKKNRTRQQKSYRDWTETPRRESAPQQPGIPADTLRGLLQLCHPDKHGNSDLSVKMTQWLLDQKRRTT